MIIAGYYGIKFNLHKILNLCFCAFTFMIPIILYKYTIGITSIKDVIYTFFPYANYMRWFLTVYILISIISPIINNGLNTLSKEYNKLLILLLFIINFLFFLLLVQGGNIFFGLLLMYILGRYIRISDINISKGSAIFLFLLSNIIMIIISTLLNQFDLNRYIFLLYKYNNPLIIIEAISLFMFFHNFKPFTNRYINLFSITLFAVYIITETLQKDLLYDWIYSIFLNNILYGILSCICVYATCMILEYLRLSFFNPLKLNKVNSFIDSIVP